MPKKLPIAIDNFASLVAPENDYVYIDKSLFIREVLQDRCAAFLLTRPRHWGKTLNLSMLHYFLSATVNGVETRALFKDLANCSR